MTLSTDSHVHAHTQVHTRLSSRSRTRTCLVQLQPQGPASACTQQALLGTAEGTKAEGKHGGSLTGSKRLPEEKGIKQCREQGGRGTISATAVGEALPGRGELRQRHSTNEGGRQLGKGTPGKGQGSAKARECSRNRRKAPWWGLKVYLSC